MKKIFLLIILLFLFAYFTNAQNVINAKSNILYNVLLTNEVADNVKPSIEIIEPDVTRGFITVTYQTYTVKAKVTDQSGILSVYINNTKTSFVGNDIFQATINLAYGDNTINVKATDTKNNTAFESFKIVRKDDDDNDDNDKEDLVNVGTYYALIIGNNDYQDGNIIDLDNPINDATTLYNVLTKKYTFDTKNVIFLKNATYVQMIEAFDNLSKKVTENDNLLIFYAGHGWWEADKELGYWLPVDARKTSTAFWIRNSTISDYMSSIKSKHTLLIADACFSGSIFKTRIAFDDADEEIKSLYGLPSQEHQRC